MVLKWADCLVCMWAAHLVYMMAVVTVARKADHLANCWALSLVDEMVATKGHFAVVLLEHKLAALSALHRADWWVCR